MRMERAAPCSTPPPPAITRTPCFMIWLRDSPSVHFNPVLPRPLSLTLTHPHYTSPILTTTAVVVVTLTLKRTRHSNVASPTLPLRFHLTLSLQTPASVRNCATVSIEPSPLYSEPPSGHLRLGNSYAA
uniref:Uncharacterized protein n=1 Tax=Cacopsylla melanoneura TaxID=428564 RepID=A0A8D9E1A6_9HEMI